MKVRVTFDLFIDHEEMVACAMQDPEPLDFDQLTDQHVKDLCPKSAKNIQRKLVGKPPILKGV